MQIAPIAQPNRPNVTGRPSVAIGLSTAALAMLLLGVAALVSRKNWAPWPRNISGFMIGTGAALGVALLALGSCRRSTAEAMPTVPEPEPTPRDPFEAEVERMNFCQIVRRHQELQQSRTPEAQQQDRLLWARCEQLLPQVQPLLPREQVSWDRVLELTESLEPDERQRWRAEFHEAFRTSDLAHIRTLCQALLDTQPVPPPSWEMALQYVERLDETDGGGSTALRRAIADRDLPRAQALLALGVNVMRMGQRGTDLHAAVAKAPMLIPQLVAAGADVNARDTEQRTALHWAAKEGRAEAVRQLIAAQANVNINGGILVGTPLIQAAESGHLEVVNLLLEAQADVLATGTFGVTALGWAAASGHDSVVERLLRVPGTDINARFQRGRTALNMAASARRAGPGHAAVVRRLLATQGTEADALDEEGLSALDGAQRAGNAAIVQILQEHRQS